ncbi:MAG TPA: glutathione S-transferase family protein [Gammaproteobacteria bacterium]|nr:glutathione S-transferase family protein [Gammaproteobacteria bacterium]
MIRLHSTKASINGYKVRLLLALLDLPYELVELDMYAGEHKREPFLTLNPFGQMPALADGDYTIADSHACLVYVARKYDAANRWLPVDAEGEAKVAEWLSKSANEVHQGPWMKRAKIRRPDAIKLSDAEIDARCDHILKLMEAHFAQRDWLALGRPTIADVSCFGPISMLKVSGYDTDRWPDVTRWLDRIRALPLAHDIDGKPFA